MECLLITEEGEYYTNTAHDVDNICAVRISAGKNIAQYVLDLYIFMVISISYLL